MTDGSGDDTSREHLIRETAEAVGSRIRALRNTRGWTLEEAAEVIGIDPKHLWKIETAYKKSNATLATLTRTAAAFGVPVADLFAPPDTTSSESSLSIRVVEPTEQEKYVSCLPLLSLEAAASAFSGVQVVEPLAWVEPSARVKLSEGMFVAQVFGRSMEPRIPHRSFCIFRSPVSGSRQGRVVLVQLRALEDPETGGRYTVKRYRSTKVSDPQTGAWRHDEITLEPLNPRFAPLHFDENPREALTVVAELVEVLG